MTRFYKTAASVIALGLLAAPAMAHGPSVKFAQSAETPKIVTATDLGDGLYMLQGSGGNIGLLTGPDGAFVIDSQYANYAEANLAKIAELAGGTPRFLLNTHWHGDHTGGNAAFEGEGATVIAHDNVRVRVSTDQALKIGKNLRETPASAPETWPLLTFTDGMTLHLNGQTIQAIHVPNAHTDGDTIIKFEEANALHMGDVMFSGMWPFIDTSSDGSIDGYIAALDVAYGLCDADTTVIPGHGPVSTRDDIKALADQLRTVKGILQPLAAQGKTLDEVLDMSPLGAYVEEWATGFMTEVTFITIVYSELQAEMPQ